ncbi:hypothetical protein CXB51_007409 [Gossypium anomalum]|uniref:Uncharacterized protein n=1 Tax=Gossypium anomalum TaxID=47600 RepID=A0A8J6DBJ7_9ROSI|nr:hypothetical protein CXB51_007409 [Gossypium anomalum]
MDSLCESNRKGNLLSDPSTKKKDMVLRKGFIESKGVSEVGFTDRDLSFLEGDIKKSVVNGIPAIDFSSKVHKLLVNDMSTFVIIKLLGRNIGFVALQIKVYGL